MCRTLELYTVILLIYIYILILRNGNTINLPYIAYHREFIYLEFYLLLFCVYWRSVSRFFFFFVIETVGKCDAFASLDPMTCQRKMQGSDWLILFKHQQTSLFLHRLNQQSAHCLLCIS